jgi:hypothetical protein
LKWLIGTVISLLAAGGGIVALYDRFWPAAADRLFPAVGGNTLERAEPEPPPGAPARYGPVNLSGSWRTPPALLPELRFAISQRDGHLQLAVFSEHGRHLGGGSGHVEGSHVFLPYRIAGLPPARLELAFDPSGEGNGLRGDSIDLATGAPLGFALFRR